MAKTATEHKEDEDPFHLLNELFFLLEIQPIIQPNIDGFSFKWCTLHLVNIDFAL